jgi:hypothetical protein
LTHESFYLATVIEFTTWNDEKERTIEKFKNFNDLPAQLHGELENDSTEITLCGKKWVILEINRDLCQHGKGMHVKVRLGLPSIHEKI